MKICAVFYFELQRSLDITIQVACFKNFWTNVSKLALSCRGVHDREFEPTEASEISRPSVSDGSDNDDVCGRNATETSRLSLSGILEFEADEDLVPGNLPEMDWDIDFANIKNVIDGAGVGLDDHGQSSYAPNSDAQDQDQVKEMLQWFREAIPNVTEAWLIQYHMA